MKEEINVYASKDIYSFVYQLFENYKVSCMPIEALKKNNLNESAIIFIKSRSDQEKINLIEFNNNFLIISNNLNSLTNYGENFILKAPTTPNQIINSVKKLIANKKFVFEDICINNKKIINTKNKKYCMLTDIENNILIKLIEIKKCQKDYLKENILNISHKIDTHSLDSHLSRIRKKFEKIQTSLSLKSKKNFIILD